MSRFHFVLFISILLIQGIFLTGTNRNGNTVQSAEKSDSEKKKLVSDAKYFSKKASVIKPIGLTDAFFVEPNRSVELEFKIGNASGQNSISYEIHNFEGAPTGQKGLASIHNERIVIKATFPLGHYEIHFPTLDVSFGICSLPPYSGKIDDFYAIEGLIGNRPEIQQRALIDILVRSGIHSNREWCTFRQIEPEPGKYREATDRFYQLAGSRGLKSIFCINDFPDRFAPIAVDNRKNLLPTDMSGLSDSLRNIIQRRSSGINAFHLFNEYDLKRIPSSVWLPGIKVAAWAMKDLPFIFASAPFATGAGSETPLLESLDNHLLDVIDVFTLHNYGKPESVIEQVAFFREKFASYGRGDVPLWLTECGKPWNRGLAPELIKEVYGGPLGRLRPNVEDDRLSALWITMKGIEAKATGIERYFPFTLPFFQERNNNFGMLDYFGTPLRSLAAYCNSIRELGGKHYIGDVQWSSKSSIRFRLFSDGHNNTAVLYTGSTDKKIVKLSGLPVTSCRSIDGRTILPQKNSVYEIENGLAYFDFPTGTPDRKLYNTETEANRLLSLTKNRREFKRGVSPIVYSYKINDDARYNENKFFWKSDLLTVRVYNLSDQPQKIAPELQLPKGARVALSPKTSELTIPSKSKKDIQWQLDMSQTRMAVFHIKLKDARFPLAGFSLPFFDDRKIVGHTLDFMNPQNWKSNSSGKSTFEYDEKEKALKVTTTFAPGSNSFTHWVFPEFSTARATDLFNRAIGINYDIKIIQDEGRTEKMRSSCVMLVPVINKKKPYTAISCADPEKEWKSVSVSFPGLDEPLRAIRIGTCPAGYQVTFWIRNVKLLCSEE